MKPESLAHLKMLQIFAVLWAIFMFCFMMEELRHPSLSGAGFMGLTGYVVVLGMAAGVQKIEAGMSQWRLNKFEVLVFVLYFVALGFKIYFNFFHK